MVNDDFLMDEDERISIDFSKYFARLKAHKKTLIWWTAGAFVLGCLIALATPHKYVVVTKLAPELSSTATSRLSSMASLVGLSSSVLGTTDAVYPMVYPDLVKSPEFIADLFKVPVTVRTKKETFQTDLYDYMENYAKKSVIGEVLGLPGRAIGALKDRMSGEFEAEEDSLAVVDPFQFTRKQGMVFKALRRAVEATIDKKTLVVTVEVTMDDKIVAAELARAVDAQLRDYVTRYRTEKSIEIRDYYRRLNQEAQEDYYEAQREYSRYVDSHQGLVMQSVMIEKDRLRNEMQLKYQLYTSMAQNLQSAEAKVEQETPVFAEIVSPSVPLRSADSRKRKALAFALVGLLAGACVVLWKYRKE